MNEPSTLSKTRSAPPAPIADDLLRGADAIAEFVFGSAKHRRKVYYFASGTKVCRLPVFRMGSVLCARKSSLVAWIEQQEEMA